MQVNGKNAKEFIGLLDAYGYTDIFSAGTLQPVSVHSDFSNCHYDIVARPGNPERKQVYERES